MAIELKALVDNANNRVIFVESGSDFVDVLFSFLTMPIGTIIKRTHKKPQKMPIGSLSNLYGSVENLDISRLKSKTCKTMLLHPRNGYRPYLKDLKLTIDEFVAYKYCLECKLLRQYEVPSELGYCDCGRSFNWAYFSWSGSKKVESETPDDGVFVKGFTRFLISDELKVLPLSTTLSFSLISEIGIMDASSIEEKIFKIQKAEVLQLLKSSLLLKLPLTHTLLKPKGLPELKKETSVPVSSEIPHQIKENISKENGKICIKLMLSKSKKRVYYAEVDDDFVDLLFSFLTIPLGYIIRKMRSASLKGLGSINLLYESIKDLDCEKYFKSDGHKQILLSPKISSVYNYKYKLLGVDEFAYHEDFYYFFKNSYGEETICYERPSSHTAIMLSCNNSEPVAKRAKTGGGFVMGPGKFMVTDDLIVTPISIVSGMSVLNKLNIPFNDIEEHLVHVGNEEALKLLVASFESESVLTDTFLRN